MNYRFLSQIILFLTCAIGGPAAAQFPGMELPAPGGVRERVSASIVARNGALVPGGEGMIAIVLDIQRGWKIQAGSGSGDEVEPYIPTSIELSVPEGWEVGRMLWPRAGSFELGDGDYVETLSGYEGRIAVAVPVRVSAMARMGETTVRATVQYQACDADQCEMPVTKEISTRLRIVDEGSLADVHPLDARTAALIDETLEHRAGEAGEDKSTSQQVDKSTVDAEDSSESDHGAEVQAPVAPVRAGPSFFGWTLPENLTAGPFGLVILALLAALGGFILNLTPCVLPVIPIKIMSIMQHANKPGKNLALGLWMSLGVIVFWVALGLPVAFVAGVTDPSRIFGIWWFTLGIGVLIAVMGIGIMGMFTIQLPQSVYMVNPKADTAGGSFLLGVMTGVLGLPCFGFVAGALLVGSATMPPTTIMTIFTSLGFGMAAPYMVLSMKPSLVERLPRTGPASELVKQVIGLLLLAAAAFFVGSGLLALVADRPYLSDQLHWWAVGLFAALAALWTIVRVFQITHRAAPRLAFLLIGLVFGSLGLLYAASSTEKARGEWEIRQAALAEAGGSGTPYVTGIWNDFTPDLVQQARDDGRIVVLDFTANWCVNCKALRAAVLDPEPVRSHLNADDVVKFTVDLTSVRGPGADLLKELGHTGIPLLVIYTPGSEKRWESNAYTPEQVIAAINAARTNGLAMAP